MKKTILFALALGFLFPAMAQTNPKEEKDKAKAPEPKVSAKLYGFVRNYFNYDSRQTYYVVGGEYNMIPKDESWSTPDENNPNRFDQNAIPQFHLMAITTRVGLNLTGPGILGATSSQGKIEADFGGFSTTNTVLRIRHAYCKLNWDKEGDNSELLVGQTWHPLSGDIMPEVLGMAAGAPFRPHSRTPQVRYQYYHGNFGVTASALSQVQYMNNGPSWDGSKWTSTNSTSFAYNAILPEFFLGLNYKSSKVYAQLGIDYQTLRPRTYGFVGTDKVAVDETLNSFTPTLYFQYTEGLFALKFRSLLAQNTSHLNQLVGYGVTNFDPLTGVWEYTPMQASISYLNLAYGKKVRANIFLGYQENLGLAGNKSLATLADGSANIYSKGNYTNVQSIWRICPGVSYNTKAFNIGIEYELTGVAYGNKNAMNPNGTFDAENTHEVLGHRICALVKYNF